MQQENAPPLDPVDSLTRHMERLTIKLADLIDNTKSIVAYDPNFARVYMKEKAELIAGMTGHPALRSECLKAVQSYFGVYA